MTQVPRFATVDGYGLDSIAQQLTSFCENNRVSEILHIHIQLIQEEYDSHRAIIGYMSDFDKDEIE